MLDDGQDVRGHSYYDVVGVGVRHQAGEGAVAVHAEAAAVVDDNEGDAAGFGGFGCEADACLMVFSLETCGCEDGVVFFGFEIDIPAPAPTMAVPDSICFLKAARISLRSVGGAIVVTILRRKVKAIGNCKFVSSL